MECERLICASDELLKALDQLEALVKALAEIGKGYAKLFGSREALQHFENATRIIDDFHRSLFSDPYADWIDEQMAKDYEEYSHGEDARDQGE